MGVPAQEPLVSIIMPVWNGAACVPEAVASVLAQSYKNWELVIVDDGSTDLTGTLLDKLTDPRICVIHRNHRGVSAARNSGLDAARGEFITFLDADDALPMDSLRVRVLHLLENPQADVVDGRITVRDEHLNQIVRHRLPGAAGPLFPRLVRLSEEVFFGPFYMVRRASLGPTRFRADMTHAEDLAFFLEAAGGRELHYTSVPEEVYIYRKSGSSAMGDLDGIERGYLRLFRIARGFPSAPEEDIDYLYRRIRRILTRSWLRRLRPLRALRAWIDLYSGYRKRRPQRFISERRC